MRVLNHLWNCIASFWGKGYKCQRDFWSLCSNNSSAWANTCSNKTKYYKSALGLYAKHSNWMNVPDVPGEEGGDKNTWCGPHRDGFTYAEDVIERLHSD